MLMIGLHLSVQYSGYLSSARENAFVAVEEKKQNSNNHKTSKKDNNKKK